MTLYIQLVATDDRCYSKSMKNGKGRIEPWQPRKRQRRKRSTKRSISKQQTGDAEASPKFFWQKLSSRKQPFHACPPERSNTIRLRIVLCTRKTLTRLRVLLIS